MWSANNGQSDASTTGVIQREFYARPQRLQPPVWPPAIPASQAAIPISANSGQQLSPKERGFIYGGAVTNPPGSGRFTTRLGRIQEGAGSGSNSILRTSSPPPSHRIVSERTRQFEQGQCQMDRTMLYRSELARLGAKRYVPNVEVRRRQFENRAANWKAQRESRSLDSTERGYTERPRSNSVEGVIVSDDTWPQRHKAVRQDSYLAAVKKPVTSSVSDSPAVTPEGDSSPQSSPGLDSVVRRHKSISDDNASEDERATRRVSYLKATSGDRMHVDSDFELSDNEQQSHLISSSIHHSQTRVLAVPPFYDKEDVTFEGPLICKITLIDGKKAPDRSWKSVWAVLRGSTLYLFRDKKDATSENCQFGSLPQLEFKVVARQRIGTSSEAIFNQFSKYFARKTPVDHERVDLRGASATAAEDYTKRRHVLRLSAPSSANSSEILLQAESAQEMTKWLQVLQQTDNNNQSQDANRVSGTTSSSVSPVAAHKGIMKLTSFRNRSPTGQSPVNKTRKPSQSDSVQLSSSPKSKTWKGRVAKQLRKMQPGAGSPLSPTAPSSQLPMPYPEGATIGVPLELCPPSINSEYVPLLVELCTGIVEARGLEVIGIYRVPGNTAAVTSLTEAVNRGLDAALLDQDQRWSDVNVISSLLKLFFRKLPDCLLTTELYPFFIKADKIEDSRSRIATIRKLVSDLPEHHYQTLKHLLFHLKLVVDHSMVNKMEARNLAIVFGPTLIRGADDNMVTMVTDMSHQCRIVETLILHVEWCFSEEGVENLQLKEVADNSEPSADGDLPLGNQTLLLDNIHKVEGMKDSPTRDVSARDIVSSIITAANRKMQKARSRKPFGSSSDESHHQSSSTTAVTATTTTTVTSSSTTTTATSSEKHKADSSKVMKVQNRKERICSAEDASALVERANHQRSGSVGAVASTVTQSVIFSGTITNKLTASDDPLLRDVKTEQKGLANNSVTRVTSEDGTIRTYTGLSQTTQERIRRFEMETKAMLLRSQPRENDRQSDYFISKQELDSEDSATNPTAIGKKIAGEGNGTVKVEKENSPLVRWRQITNPGAATGVLDSIGKRLKTGKEMSLSSSSLTRRGSLDSLKDAVVCERSQATNLADECGDLVLSLTSTFDAKMRSLSVGGSGSDCESRTCGGGKKDRDTEKETRRASSAASLSQQKIFRDPSLHRHCTSPEHQFKAVAEDGVRIEDKTPAVMPSLTKENYEKDEEKENNCVGNKVVRRSESSSKDKKEGGGGVGVGGGRVVGEKGGNGGVKGKKDNGSSAGSVGGSVDNKLKRSDSLTKTEKTESNLYRRRQLEAAGGGGGGRSGAYKMKRKTGSGHERSIKRRHTVGGTKDFDRTTWLDNRQREAEEEALWRKERRTSSPDLSAGVLSEVIIVRPLSLIEPGPLESHI